MVDSGLNGCWRLTVRSQFSAAHALRHYQGKCERLHGHNFAVELHVEGDTLAEDTHMLVDFSVLKDALAHALAPLDHLLLNEISPFDNLNPSSEQLARYIALAAAQFLRGCPAAKHVRVVGAAVSEKDTQTALWLAPVRWEQPDAPTNPAATVDVCSPSPS